MESSARAGGGGIPGPGAAAPGGSPGGAQQPAARRSGKIPISILIEPTNAGESGNAVPTPSSYRRTSSSEAGSPNVYDPRRPSLPVPYLTHHTSSESSASLSPTRFDPAYLSRRGGAVDNQQPLGSLERSDSPWTSSDLTRKPRPPRPSYSEEQKFFIMYARIIQDHSWPEIEDQFAEIFGQRSKGGLTSVYYRVRKDWGLMEVLKSGPGSFVADRSEVERRALNFSTEFLAQIGYIER